MNDLIKIFSKAAYTISYTSVILYTSAFSMHFIAGLTGWMWLHSIDMFVFSASMLGIQIAGGAIVLTLALWLIKGIMSFFGKEKSLA